MTAFDRLKVLLDERKLSINELEEKLEIGKNSLYSWKKGIPKGTNLIKVADYFDVSVDYLLGRTEDRKTSLAEKYGVFAFDGEPVTDEEVEFLKSVLAAKRAAENK